MTRIMGIAVLALLSVGCATSSSVKEQLNPLADRITALEKQNADMGAKLADLSKKADGAAIDVQAVKKDLADTRAAAQTAQTAAADAKTAADRAETAASKALAAFELKQVKGAK
jgi:uncharacterized protein (UPF0335 family)